MQSARTIVVATLLHGCLASVVVATIVETSSARDVHTYAYASALEDGPNTINGPSIYGVMESAVTSFQSGIKDRYGSGYASQSSIISPGAYSGELEARVSAESGTKSSGDATGASAGSMLSVLFTVTDGIEYNLSGSSSVFGPGSEHHGEYVPEAFIYLHNRSSIFPDEGVIYVLGLSDGFQSFASSGILGAGEYELYVWSLASVEFGNEVSGSYLESEATIDFSLILTPAPSAAMLFGIGGIFGYRRKR